MEDINKDIENLEEIINLINKELDKKDKNVSAILDLKDLLSLRNLIKEYKELEEENIQLEACKDEAIIRYNFESIPVSLVEEKIEEIQKEYEETLKTANFKEIEKMNKINFRGITLEGQRSILRELLEKRK